MRGAPTAGGRRRLQPRAANTAEREAGGRTWSPAPGERPIARAYTTGYSWFDNTPPGSARISHPQVHRQADGVGTYADPITAAVGHSLASGEDVLDLPADTRLYVPHLRRYFVVEDTCGDGKVPQRLGCHDLSTAPSGAQLWVDLYVGGGKDDDRRDVQSCAGRVTDGDGDLHMIILNPRPDYAVAGQPIFHGGRCSDLYPGTPVEVGAG